MLLGTLMFIVPASLNYLQLKWVKTLNIQALSFRYFLSHDFLIKYVCVACCGETQSPLHDWRHSLTAAVCKEEVEELWDEGAEGWRCLKNVGTQLVKYHPWTKTIATTVVLEDVCSTYALFMSTVHLGSSAVHSYQQFVKFCCFILHHFILVFWWNLGEKMVFVSFILYWPI